MCCGYPLEAPHQDSSNEYPHFHGEIRKNIMWISPHHELWYTNLYAFSPTFLQTVLSYFQEAAYIGSHMQVGEYACICSNLYLLTPS